MFKPMYRRGGCTTEHLAMKKVVFAEASFGKSMIVVEKVLKFIGTVLKWENEFAISEFEGIQTFWKKRKLESFFLKFVKKSEN